MTWHLMFCKSSRGMCAGAVRCLDGGMLRPVCPPALQDQQRRMLAHKIQMQILAHRLDKKRTDSPIQGKDVLLGHKSQREPVELPRGAVQAPGGSCSPGHHKRAASGRGASRSAASESSPPRAVRSASVPCLGRSLSALLSRESGGQGAGRSALVGGGTSSARDAPAVPGRSSLDTCSSRPAGATVAAGGSSGAPSRHNLDSRSLPASRGRAKPSSGLLGPLRRSLSPLRSLSPFRRRGSGGSGRSRRSSASDDGGLQHDSPGQRLDLVQRATAAALSRSPSVEILQCSGTASCHTNTMYLCLLYRHCR